MVNGDATNSNLLLEPVHTVKPDGASRVTSVQRVQKPNPPNPIQFLADGMICFRIKKFDSA